MNLRQRILAAAAGLFVLAGSGAAHAAMEPKDVVLTLYSEENLSLSAARSQVYFARDLDAALKADTSRPGEVGAVDFDYRYGAQDLQVSGLQLIQEVDNDEARVVAVFKNFGKANSVDWTLCRRPTGEWRIADASSNTGAEDWDLRQMLRLPTPVHC
jgi:hypothetical protein